MHLDKTHDDLSMSGLQNEVVEVLLVVLYIRNLVDGEDVCMIISTHHGNAVRARDSRHSLVLSTKP